MNDLWRQKGLDNILTFVKSCISLRLLNEITRNFACGYTPLNWRTSFKFYGHWGNRLVFRLVLQICKTTLFVFSSVPIIFGLVLVEQIFTDLTNSKLTFDFGTTPTISENEDVWKRDLEVWKLVYYLGDHKTWTMFFNLVVCIHMQSLKWFHLIIVKIYTIWQMLKCCANLFDVIDHLIWISHKSKYFKN